MKPKQKKRNTNKFRKSIKNKNQKQMNGNTQKTNWCLLNFTEPEILEKSTEGNQMKMKFRNFNMVYDIVITRVGVNEYYYEDKGLFKRKFTDLSLMFWEFELPKSLRGDILSLPIIQNKETTYSNWEKMFN